MDKQDKKITRLQKQVSELQTIIRQTGKRGEEKKSNRLIGSKKVSKKFVPQKVLYTWKVPARIFVQRDKLWFLKIAVIALLLVLFFAFLQDFMVILVICTIVLVCFLLASMPPEFVEHKITNKGVNSIGEMYRWDALQDFWIVEKSDKKIVYVSTRLGFPRRLLMLLAQKDELSVVKLLGRYLDYQEFQEKQSKLSKLVEGQRVNPQRYSKLFQTSKSSD